jgi:hypothetical protein
VQAEVPDHKQIRSTEIVDPLDERPRNPASEIQTIKLPNPEETDVVLRRQGEHVEQRSVDENKIENVNLDSNEV